MSDFKITRSDELMHYRTKGSKNGVRLYQNPDGSLTPLGERHYRDMYGYGKKGGVLDSVNRVVSKLPEETKSMLRDANKAADDRWKAIEEEREKRTHAYQGTPGKRPLLYPGRINDPLNYLRISSDNPMYNRGGKPKILTKGPSQMRPESRKDVLGDAYNSASKWVVDRADDVKKGATNSYNDASKWVVDRADDAKKGVTDAYKKASDAAVKVGDAAKNAYNDASKWVVDRADDARYAAEGAYNSAKNAVTDFVDRVKETYGPGVADVARVTSELPKNLNDPHLKEGFDNSYNAVKEWVTTAADDVKNTASEAFDSGKKWVDQAAKDVGKFADSAVSDVTKAVDDAKNGVANAANAVGKAAQDGWNWVKGLFGGRQQDDYGKDEDKDRSNHSSSSHKM